MREATRDARPGCGGATWLDSDERHVHIPGPPSLASEGSRQSGSSSRLLPMGPTLSTHPEFNRDDSAEPS